MQPGKARPRADALDREIGEQVRARRLLVGMTQEKLGDALGVSFQQVQKYEKGTNRISAARLRQVAAALDVPVALFYEGEGIDGEARPALVDPARGGQDRRLARAFERIEDAVVRQRVLDLVESLAPRG